MSSSRKTIPDFYQILGVAPSATPDRIVKAYKRRALLEHPYLRRHGSTCIQTVVPSDKPAFDLVNRAYYVLSDPARRLEYDAALSRERHGAAIPVEPCPSQALPEKETMGGLQLERSDNRTLFDGGIWGNSNPLQLAAQWYLGVNPLALRVFDEVFEPLFAAELEAMAKEVGVDVSPGGSTWAMVGSISGGIAGFFAAYMPGAVVGFMAGYKIGLVRDRTGVPVMETFRRMSDEQRRTLARRVSDRLGLTALRSHMQAMSSVAARQYARSVSPVAVAQPERWTMLEESVEMKPLGAQKQPHFQSTCLTSVLEAGLPD